MKILSKYIITGLLSLSLFSCYKDDSSVGTNPITELSINMKEVTAPTINQEKNEPLVIDPIITQKGTEKPVTYEWEINYELFSTEKKLVYPCSKLGTYNVRLKVTNEDGSAYKSFKVNVNSPYEEGLMLLSEDEQGEGSLSFMRKFTPAEIAAGKTETFVGNVFSINNPGEKLGKFPTDIVKRQKQVFISSRGEKKIYYLNDKTFELEAVITAPDIPDFKPIAMNVPDAAFRTSTILCEGGKLLNLALLENLVMTHTKYNTPVINKTDFGSNINDCFNYYWDPVKSQMLQYSAYYTTSSLTAFEGQDLLNFFYDGTLFYVVTKSKTNPSVITKTVFSKYIQNPSTKKLDIIQQAQLNVDGSTELEPSCVTKVNGSFKKLIYAKGNKVYSWFYTGTEMPTTPFITVDEGVVTALEQSTDGSLLYVGVYNAAASGMKGSVYVYNMDNGALIKKHTGISNKPVKLFYKKK